MDTDHGQAGAAGKRRGSRILFWLVTREFLLPLACCLLAFSALFLFADVFDNLEDFTSRSGRAAPGSRWEIVLYPKPQPSQPVVESKEKTGKESGKNKERSR